MTEYTVKGLTKAQNELLNSAVESYWAVFVGPRQIRTADKLAELGLGRRYYDRGQSTGARFALADNFLDRLEILEVLDRPYGRYVTAKIKEGAQQ